MIDLTNYSWRRNVKFGGYKISPWPPDIFLEEGAA
jgi:hypothetical protein